ncbi:MAG: hypothetical protein ABR581_06300 [Thermoleophilaceae bacterium]
MRAFLVPLVGVVVGLAYVVSGTVQRWARPVVDLLRAVRPIAAPVLVVAAAATIHLHWALQGLAAILLVVAVWRLIVRPERGGVIQELAVWWREGRKDVRAFFRHRPTLGVLALVVLTAVGAQLLSDSGWFANQGGGTVALLLIGFVTWGAALTARLIAYAASPIRAIVSILIAVAVARSLMWAGVLPWEKEIFGRSEWTSADRIWVYAGLALLLAVVVDRGKAPQSRLWRPAAAVGLGLAVVAGFAVMGASAWSLWQTSRTGGDPLAKEGGDRTRLYTENDPGLAHRFAPVLAFTSDERWSPIAVEEYYGAKKFAVLRPDDSPASLDRPSCPSVGPPACLHMTIHCPSGSEDPDCAFSESHKQDEIVPRGAAYVRTLRRPASRDHSPDATALRGVFQDVTPTAKRLHSLIQYWLFYAYDEWETSVLWGELVQRHESDWEAVTVGLGARDAPLFVAYSAHCGGKWRPWKDVKRAFDDHPLVAVARGSHANYPRANDRRPPDWTSCSRIPEGIGALISYAANVRDKTSDDWHWGAKKLVPVTEGKPPMSFPGTWGRNDQTVLVNAKMHKSKPGGGPQSPPLQPLWQRPVTTIFCGAYWHGPERCKRR